MIILVACEESQAVTTELRKLGHLAWSCDLLPCSGGHPEWHLQQDVIPLLNESWDMIIAFPPCTYLTSAGARWLYHPEDRHLHTSQRRAHPLYPTRREDQRKAVAFVKKIYDACDKVVIENPVGALSSQWRKPDQIIRPTEHGHGSTKKTCLWMKGVNKIKPTKIVEPEFYISSSGRKWDKWFFESSLISNLEERSLFRSKTFPGIAKAIATQLTSL